MEEKKRKSQPYAERKFDKANKQAYDHKYETENLDRIQFLAPKGYKDKVKAAATKKGMTLAEFVRECIDSHI